jgi:tRNA(fMet)-specific endonuclease VapC
MYLLDTNHCSRIIFGDEHLCNKIKQIDENLISTNIIVKGELIFMAEKSDNKVNNLTKVTAFLEDINLFFITEKTADIYGELKAELINYFGPKEK